jgi:hypothetical protein
MSNTSSPVHFDAARPARYDGAQLLIRILLMIALGVVGAPLGWVFSLLYLGLPLVAAAVIGGRGAEAYRTDVAPTLLRVLRWIVGIHAYLGLVTDRMPTREQELVVRFELTPSGSHSAGRALLHLVTSIPVAIVLWLFSVVSTVLWIVGAITVLVSRTVPEGIVAFQRGMLRMFAELLLHHASLLPGAAPIRFDTSPDIEGPVAGAAHSA